MRAFAPASAALTNSWVCCWLFVASTSGLLSLPHRPHSQRRCRTSTRATPNTSLAAPRRASLRLTSSAHVRKAPARAARHSRPRRKTGTRRPPGGDRARCRSRRFARTTRRALRLQVPQPAPAIPAEHAFGRKGAAVAADIERHVARQRTIAPFDSRRAVPAAETHAVLGDAALLDEDRIGCLVDFDRIRHHDAVADRTFVGQPAVMAKIGGAARQGQHQLGDVVERAACASCRRRRRRPAPPKNCRRPRPCRRARPSRKSCIGRRWPAVR